MITKSINETVKWMLCAALFTAHCSLFTGCSDDPLKGYVPGDEELAIVSNDLLFDAGSATKSVTVSTADALTATLDAEWCTAQVSGQTVSVTVQANVSYESRVALLTLRAGGASRQLPVQQQGAVFGTMPVKDRQAAMDGETFTYTVRHTLPMTVTSPDEWLHPAIDGERLTVTADANGEGHLRRGVVVSDCAGVKDTMRIVQFDLTDDVAGSYYMVGNSGSPTGPYIATRFDIVERGDSIFMHWTNQESWLNTYLPLRLDRASCTIFFPSAMTLASGNNSSDVAYFYDSAGRVASSPANGANARLSYNASTGYRNATLTAANWPGHQLGGFIIRINRGGLVTTSLLQIANPVIIRVGQEGTVIN